MSCLQPFLVLSLAAMSRKKEKEDVDMEEEEEEEEEWEEDEPWRNSKGRKTGGGTTSWARQARRAAKQAKRVVMSTGKPLEKGEEALAKGKPLEKGNKNKALAKGTPLEKGKALAKGQNEARFQELKDKLTKSLKKGKLGPRLETGTPLEKGAGASSSNAAPLEKGEKNLLKKRRQQPLKKGNSLKKEMLPKRWQFWSQRLPPTSRQNPLQKGRRLQPLKKGQKRSSLLKPNQNLWLCWLIGTIA